MAPTGAGPQVSSREKRLQYDKARRASIDQSLSDDQGEKYGYNYPPADEEVYADTTQGSADSKFLRELEEETFFKEQDVTFTPVKDPVTKERMLLPFPRSSKGGKKGKCDSKSSGSSDESSSSDDQDEKDGNRPDLESSAREVVKLDAMRRWSGLTASNEVFRQRLMKKVANDKVMSLSMIKKAIPKKLSKISDYPLWIKYTKEYLKNNQLRVDYIIDPKALVPYMCNRYHLWTYLARFEVSNGDIAKTEELVIAYCNSAADHMERNIVKGLVQTVEHADIYDTMLSLREFLQKMEDLYGPSTARASRAHHAALVSLVHMKPKSWTTKGISDYFTKLKNTADLVRAYEVVISNETIVAFAANTLIRYANNSCVTQSLLSTEQR